MSLLTPDEGQPSIRIEYRKIFEDLSVERLPETSWNTAADLVCLYVPQQSEITSPTFVSSGHLTLLWVDVSQTLAIKRYDPIPNPSTTEAFDRRKDFLDIVHSILVHTSSSFPLSLFSEPYSDQAESTEGFVDKAADFSGRENLKKVVTALRGKGSVMPDDDYRELVEKALEHLESREKIDIDEWAETLASDLGSGKD